uniref:Uncharacterized protein n=1 Tax=Rhizophora mucronata TaxID=61149 RepID=A0A2P2QEI7_RHIMU
MITSIASMNPRNYMYRTMQAIKNQTTVSLSNNQQGHKCPCKYHNSKLCVSHTAGKITFLNSAENTILRFK